MNKQSKILTLDDLYQFFVEQNKNFNFSSKDSGNHILVTTNGFFETNETDMPEMLKLELKVCHTNTNRNGSHISTENMEKAMPTLKYRPILAYIHELEDGTKDFYAHNMEIVEHEDGETEINYIEKQVGCFTADDPWLKYDEENDKTYVHAYAVIPEGYTETADIIRRKGGTKVSCELIINELSYNAKEKYLDLTDFIFGGCTLLGCDEQGNEIGEGMLGSRADISDFCYKEPVYAFQDKMIEVLDKLNITLSNFNKNSEEKGGVEMNKFEELLAKYGKTAQDITFETDGLSDEQLEAKFKEAFEDDEPITTEEEACGKKKKKCSEEDNDDDSDEEDELVTTEEEACGKKKKKCSEENNEDDSDEDDESITTEEEACGNKKKKKCSIDSDGNMSISFEISHEDIRSALYSLISIYEEEDNEWYFITNVYDNYFVFENWDGDKLYKQSYSRDGDNIALSGDRQEMFKMILTESEKLAIEKMREDYAILESKYNELKTFKDNYDAAELKSQKDAIFSRDEYSVLTDDDAFKALIADATKYTVDEVEAKAKAIFADYVIKTGTFSAKDDGEKKPKVLGFNFNKKETKSGPYGNLFSK